MPKTIERCEDLDGETSREQPGYRWSPLPSLHDRPGNPLDEDRIERAVPRCVDSADFLYLRGRISKVEYDARLREIDAWAATMLSRRRH
jgi:hypothetical protein